MYGLNLRTSPAKIKNNTVLFLRPNVIVDVLADNYANGFAKVRYQGIVGFCTKSYLYQLGGGDF